mmetsp:Transcript_23060/g.35692  ORF Transcript_23060/g.35692 Transcript_23060/m.35692 type:complete len:80 (+) Transcript_23060:2137-2376(+)
MRAVVVIRLQFVQLMGNAMHKIPHFVIRPVAGRSGARATVGLLAALILGVLGPPSSNMKLLEDYVFEVAMMGMSRNITG